MGGRAQPVLVTVFFLALAQAWLPPLHPAPLWAAGLAPDESGDLGERNRVKLNRVVNRLVRERAFLHEKLGQEKTLLEEVEDLDRLLEEGSRRMEDLARRTDEAKNRLSELAENIRTGRIDLKYRQNRLAAHLRLMYGLGGRGMLKVIFSQESTADVRQGILYYGRLIQTRNEQFRAFQKTLQEQHRSMEEHEALLKRLQEFSVALAEEQQQRQFRREARAGLLERVRAEQGLHQRKLAELKQAQSELGSFVEALTDTLEREAPPPLRAFAPRSRPTESGDGSPAADARGGEDGADAAGGSPVSISRRKGRLSRPVGGRADNKPPGQFYAVGENSPVRAVHRGQVVYADWFRGYGLLIILNHGEHVYTLYGHNRRLLVSQGAWVDADEQIALSGDTGSLDGIPGLYFELRHMGKPVSPGGWLMAANRGDGGTGRGQRRSR